MEVLYDKLANLIEKHSAEIVRRWLEAIQSDPATASFSKNNVAYVRSKAGDLLRHINQWIGYDASKQEIGKRYAVEGRDMFDMGVPLCEVIRAMYVLRRTLWQFVENESGFDSAFELKQMRELDERITRFFDRAEYYVIRGYMEEMNRKMKELWRLTSADTDKIFFERSFYYQ